MGKNSKEAILLSRYTSSPFATESKVHIICTQVPPRLRRHSNVLRADATVFAYVGEDDSCVEKIRSLCEHDCARPWLGLRLDSDLDGLLSTDPSLFHHKRINVTGIDQDSVAKSGLHVNEIAQVLYRVFRYYEDHITTVVSGAHPGVEIAAAAAAVAARIPNVNVYLGITRLTSVAERAELPVRVRNQIDAIVGHLK